MAPAPVMNRRVLWWSTMVDHGRPRPTMARSGLIRFWAAFRGEESVPRPENDVITLFFLVFGPPSEARNRFLGLKTFKPLFFEPFRALESLWLVPPRWLGTAPGHRGVAGRFRASALQRCCLVVSRRLNSWRRCCGGQPPWRDPYIGTVLAGGASGGEC